MKMSQLEIENLPGGKVKVEAQFRDRLKRPAGVSVSLRKGELAPQGSSMVLEGDLHEVASTMYCLAEVAWNMGWRPPGLGPTLMNVVDNYKFRSA